MDKDNDNTFESVIEDKRQIDPRQECIYNENLELVNSLVDEIFQSNILTDKQSKQLKMYYIDGMTLQQIGDKFGVSREAVRQAIKNSIAKIRSALQ